MRAVKNEKLRFALKIIIPFFLIPGIVALGVTVFNEKKYSFISLAVTALSLLLFAAGFENKKTGNRRLIIVSVMVALSVVGRFIPFFKPVTALTVITAIYLGGEAGFLVGALSAVISNFYFGQGPWTPFQMLAWGLIGLFAGFLSQPLKKSRVLLCLYAVVAGLLYSFVMDVWSVVWYSGSPTLNMYLAAIGTALPFTALYAASNVLFLLLLGRPFGEKLERVKLKYGV